ncbi:Proline-rich receptor-like protein kinase PERK2 [Micromonospora saelicesensis]|uniref:Proline-rich receptor-like protein kinase PERK2 n=1 Tax=Micromonospora saelicesensis TaxID=285676 RepID=A0ABX9CK86_9ACTN|nr:Proline-rich receptor-like protein kinase PERK2 [Micromonospora saelicesensis]
MTVTSVPCAPWRIAWAERENERRQRAYRDATDAWRHRDDHLARLRIEAASFLGCTQPRTGLPVELDDDELVFRVLPVAQLVEAEARHIPGLPRPGGLCSFAETSSQALPAGLRVVDTGMAVVTSHRVVFGGREYRREWRYADLVGAAHHPDVPVTLLPDRCRLQGLLVPANAVVNFRFYLTLAATDDRGAVIAQVDALLAAHRAAPPAPLLLVDPDDAPLTAVRPDRRALGAAAVAAVVFVTLGPGALGPGAWGPRGPVPSTEIVALDLPRAGTALVPIGPVGPVAPRSRVGSADSAIWSPPSVPAVRPSAVSTVEEAAVAVALPPAAPPSVAPAPSASSVPTPGPVPTTDPPTPTLPTPPVMSASPTPTPTVTATPSPGPGLLAICLDPLQLPLLDPLLCPSPAP